MKSCNSLGKEKHHSLVFPSRPGCSAEEERSPEIKQEFGKTNSSNSHHAAAGEKSVSPGAGHGSLLPPLANSTAPLGICTSLNFLLVAFYERKRRKASLAALGEQRQDKMCWLQELLPLVTPENRLAVLDWLLQPQNMIPSTHGRCCPAFGLAEELLMGLVPAKLSLLMRAAARCPSEEHIFGIKGS